MIKTRLNFTSNFLDQNNPKYKNWCKNDLSNAKLSALPRVFKADNTLLLVFLNSTKNV